MTTALIPKTLLVLGGTSDVGRATAAAFAKEGWIVQLAGRDFQALEREATDIKTRFGARVSCHLFDALAPDTFVQFVNALPTLPDAAVCVVGLLGDQLRAEADDLHARAIMRSNYEGPALILGILAERFIRRSSGTIVGVSSVAGDRGRASNYVYGSAKAGLSAFLSGLRNRCGKKGVQVVTVKPGFIRTKMTADMKLPGPITASADEVGGAIYESVRSNSDVVYVKGVWRLIMLIIRTIPESIFKRLSL